MLSTLRKLPVLRTYAALRAKTAQLQTLTAEIASLREQIAALREKTTQLKALKADLQQLREQVAEVTALRKEIEKRDELVEAHGTAVISPRRLERILRNDGHGYRDATPFPHIVIDKFLDPGVLKRAADEFAAMDRSAWRNIAQATQLKRSTDAMSTFGPFTHRLFAELNAGPFLTFLEQLTGINGVIADPHLRGGGLHEIERGGLLEVHADFNHNQRMNLWRRLNLLIYLNSDWDETWGGHLELWDRDGKTCVKRIEPIFNRAVIFDTSNFSYHGHPHPLTCPEGCARRSFALYYYTVDYPYTDDREPHSTVFIGTKE